MQFKKTIKKLFYITTLMAGSTLTALPSQAATLAISGGIFEIEFRQNASETQTATDTNTLAVANSDASAVITEAIASASFNNSSPSLLCPSESTLDTPAACNTSSSFAMGEGDNYFGLAESEAQIIGSFSLAANETFAFDFFGFLGLLANADNPELERASAQGEIFLELYDSQSQPVDSFTLSGLVDTSDNNFLTFSESQNLTYDTAVLANEELVLAFVEGTYARTFNRPIELILVETKNNRVQVRTKVPESFNSFTFIFLGVAALQLKTKKIFRFGSKSSS